MSSLVSNAKPFLSACTALLLVTTASSLASARDLQPSDASAMAGERDDAERMGRDRDGSRLTPADQSSAEADVALTRRIRQAITSDDSMSMRARNVKIITQGGVVTLRGPVKTAQERTTIATLAKNAGAVRVDNQLEIDGDTPSDERK
jgi:osmotically-inducible protein OsmY